MYYLTQIVKPCPSTLCSLRARANKNAIIWLSVFITTSENDAQTRQNQVITKAETEQHSRYTSEASQTSTSCLSVSKPQESTLLNSKFHRITVGSAKGEPTSTKASKEVDINTQLPSYLSVSTTEPSSSGATTAIQEDLGSQTSTTCELIRLQDYSLPHYKSAALLERLNFVTNLSDKTPTTPTTQKIIGCPSTAEKLQIAMNGPDLPVTPTLASKRDVTHLDLQESLTPEEEYFITNCELKKLDYIMTTIKDYFLTKGATTHQQSQPQSSLTRDYITMSCYNIELTASYYYKRFFLTGSVHDYDTFYILLGCVLLAAKVSGAPRTFNCTKPSFFAKLFANFTNQGADHFEKTLKETEEWIYMRLGYDLCTTSLLDLFVSEGCQLFFAINDDGGDISLASDDNSMKKSTEMLSSNPLMNNETLSPAASGELDIKSSDQCPKSVESFQESQQDLGYICVATDADLRVSSLNIMPSKITCSDGESKEYKLSACKVSSKSPIFECHDRLESSSPSAVAFSGRECSQVGGISPRKWPTLNTNCIPISSALCSPSKPISPHISHRFHYQQDRCSSCAIAPSFLTNPSSLNITKNIMEHTSLSSAIEKESITSHKVLNQQSPVHANHANIASDANMNISDLNMSSSIDTQSSNSRPNQSSLLSTSFSLRAGKFAKFLNTAKRSKSTGAIQFLELRSSPQYNKIVHAQSFYIRPFAKSVVSSPSDVSTFTYESKDIQASPASKQSSKDLLIPTSSSFSTDFLPRDGSKFEENLSGTIRNKPLLNISNKDTLTIASSHAKPMLDDMLAPHVLLRKVYSNHKTYASPSDAALTTPLQLPKDPNLTVKFANLATEVAIHEQGKSLEYNEVLCKSPSKKANVQLQKLSKRACRKRDRTTSFLSRPAESPVSTGKILPDGNVLSPQAIQYVPPVQLMQKWAPSRSASLKVQDSNHSALPISIEPQPLLEHGTYHDSSAEYGTDSNLSTSLSKMACSSHCVSHMVGEDILLEIPTPRVRCHSRDPDSNHTPSITRACPIHLLHSSVSRLLRISSMLMPADYTLVSMSNSKRWLKKLADTRNGIKTAFYVCKRSYISPVHISSTFKISSSSSLVGFVMLRHTNRTVNTKVMARCSRNFRWKVFNNSVLLAVQLGSISPISYIQKLAQNKRKRVQKKADSKVNHTNVARGLHAKDLLMESLSSDYQYDYSDIISIEPDSDTLNTLASTSIHLVHSSTQQNLSTDKHNHLPEPQQSDTSVDIYRTMARGRTCDAKDWSSVSEQMYKLSLTSYQNVSLSGEVHTHTTSFVGSNVSSQNELVDIHCQPEAFPYYIPLQFQPHNQCAQPTHAKLPRVPYPPALHKTLTFRNISTVSAVLQDQSFSDDYYIKKLMSSKAKTKLQELTSIEFSLVMQYILSTPPIVEYLIESCGLVKFERVYNLAHSTLQHQITSLTCFGSIEEKKRASQLTPDNVSLLAFIFAASYAYSLCFRYTDMLILFSNASISVFLMAESLLLLYNKIIPYVLMYTESICKKNKPHTTRSGSCGLSTMSPANLPLRPIRSTVSFVSKSDQAQSSTIKSKVLHVSFSGPQLTTQVTKDLTSDCSLDNESPNSAASSLSTSSSLKPLDKQVLSAETVHKILSAKSGGPILRASLYNSIIGYQEPQNTDIPVSDAFMFRMGGQQYSMISAEDASQRLGFLSTQTSFDGSRSVLSSKKDTSDDLYSIMKVAFFITDTYPHHKKLRAHQQNLSTTICDLKKKHFGFMYASLKQPGSSEPISIAQYMTGINNIFELVYAQVFPRLKFCQYFIKQPGTVFHDIRYWQMVLKLDIDKKRYRELRSMLPDAPKEQQISLKQRMNDISAKWNIADDSYWDESDSY
ncbi:Hypothetical protein GLP15_2086 [Giardia lamblia P15]|uniref:Cyclin n=1 Tax=Giardia intestinalis (strain P15) TaxID=658858 RepID=E1F036_GIAIA|nr:Hypothetical protein GLP15_2086 [Giardia lamblia P15]